MLFIYFVGINWGVLIEESVKQVLTIVVFVTGQSMSALF
jgi:hypothetical protein